MPKVGLSMILSSDQNASTATSAVYRVSVKTKRRTSQVSAPPDGISHNNLIHFSFFHADACCSSPKGLLNEERKDLEGGDSAVMEPCWGQDRKFCFAGTLTGLSATPLALDGLLHKL